MRYAMISVLALGAVATAHGEIIVEDFVDDMGNAAYDTRLNYDFGTATDFTGTGDSHALFAGELNLWADLATVTVNSLQPGEYIDWVEVTWTDFCGTDCTNLSINGAMGDSATIGNSVVSMTETVMLSTADISGEQIVSFDISSFEGRFEQIRVSVVPAPGSAALLGLCGLIATRRRR